VRERVKVLLVEDDEDDYILARDMLNDAFVENPFLRWVRSPRDGLEAISEDDFDVCLVDYRLAGESGLTFIHEASLRATAPPMILLTGQDNREVDLAAMRAGANDYLVKGQLTAPLLGRAIRYAIEHKKVTDRLVMLAQYDSLTGVANRALFLTRLSEAIAHSRRGGKRVALLLLDVDHFKGVNDTLGHPIGDGLLKEVAGRLISLTRETDTVARLGGDEFAVIATNIADEDGAAYLAQRIIERLTEPFVLEGQEVLASVSIGVTFGDPDSGTPDQMLKDSDVALYQAKSTCRGTYHFFDGEMDTRRKVQEALERDLRCALDKGEFVLHFQPKINARTREVIGSEALVRWRHRARGLVPPADFIALAEATGLIHRLGEWVMREACAQAVAWQAAGLGAMPVAVNVSVGQLKRAELVSTVGRVIAETGIDPSCLELEVTESTIVDSLDTVVRMLQGCRDLGVSVAIDDFGTGYSTLSRLKGLPVDRIKIDRSFVRNIPDDPHDVAITKAIVTLTQSLHLKVTAEGVETESQLAFLRQIGCEEAQGFYFSKPLPAEEFAAWLAAWRQTNGSPRLASGGA